MAAPKGSRQEKLNKAMPIASKVMLGDVLAELIAEQNAMKTAFNTLVAKLNADAGVTDTNYAPLTTSALVDLEKR